MRGLGGIGLKRGIDKNFAQIRSELSSVVGRWSSAKTFALRANHGCFVVPILGMRPGVNVHSSHTAAYAFCETLDGKLSWIELHGATQVLMVGRDT
jgi:hypothetical protein